MSCPFIYNSAQKAQNFAQNGNLDSSFAAASDFISLRETIVHHW
jgi:hypothetical protein